MLMAAATAGSGETARSMAGVRQVLDSASLLLNCIVLKQSLLTTLPFQARECGLMAIDTKESGMKMRGMAEECAYMQRMAVVKVCTCVFGRC
jgi:hypothetical protein